MNAFIICAMVITAVPAYSMENEVEVVEQDVLVQDAPAVWYKKRSVQIAAAAITTAAAIYAFAVYKGKVLSPVALYAGLFCAKVAQEIVTPSQNEVNPVLTDNSNKNTPVDAQSNGTVLNEVNSGVNTDNVDSGVVPQNDTKDNQQDKLTHQSDSNSNTLGLQGDTQKMDGLVEPKVERLIDVAAEKAMLFVGRFTDAAKNGFSAWQNSEFQVTQ